jgi:hypothetical protein
LVDKSAVLRILLVSVADDPPPIPFHPSGMSQAGSANTAAAPAFFVANLFQHGQTALMESTMYYNPRLRRQGQFGYDWLQDQLGSPPSADLARAFPQQQETDQPDFASYPTWAHGLMAQVYPRLDQAGRLPEPLILDQDADFEHAQFIPTKHPDCEKPANPSRRCIQEWAQAEAICAALKSRGKVPGTGRGWGRDWDECVCGHVTMECGGNPVDLPGKPQPHPKPQPRPPKGRGFFGI